MGRGDAEKWHFSLIVFFNCSIEGEGWGHFYEDAGKWGPMGGSDRPSGKCADILVNGQTGNCFQMATTTYLYLYIFIYLYFFFLVFKIQMTSINLLSLHLRTAQMQYYKM